MIVFKLRFELKISKDDFFVLFCIYNFMLCRDHSAKIKLKYINSF